MLTSEASSFGSSRFFTRRNFGLFCLAAFGGIAGKRLIGRPGQAFLPLTEESEVGPSPQFLPLRAEPVRVLPFPDMADLVPADALAELARRAIPCWYSLKTALVMHAFRLWGSEATFPVEVFARPFDSNVFSGADLQGFLLDHRYYSTIVPGEPPLLIRLGHGVEVRTESTGLIGRFAGQLGHPEDLLCACGEVGLRTDQKIITRDSSATITELVAYAIWSFDLAKEIEWTIEALARYLAPREHWTNAEGVTCTFQHALEALVAKPIGKGTCLGTHVPNTLACLARIADAEGILSDASVRSIERRLAEFSLHLDRDRDENGVWTGGWAPEAGKSAADPHRALEQKLSATGHHLEWIAIAPPQCRPRRDRIRAAVDAIIELALDMPPYEVSHLYLPFSHLVRALCLIRNTTASEASRK